MTPVIRVDDEVMGELQKRAVALRLVFSTPNQVLREVLGLKERTPVGESRLGDVVISDSTVDIRINKIYSARRWALIPFPRAKRNFFPGYKVNFELITDVGTVTTHVTADLKGTSVGSLDGGRYIQTGLRSWYDKHLELRDGSKLRIEALEPGKRYKMSVIGI